jgi:hypothetical protein
MSAALLFPGSAIVLFVRQYVSNEQLSAIVVSHRDDPIFVTTYVEHNAASEQVGMRVRFSYIGKLAPICQSDNAAPGSQWQFGHRSGHPELAELPFRNDVHWSRFTNRHGSPFDFRNLQKSGQGRYRQSPCVDAAGWGAYTHPFQT